MNIYAPIYIIWMATVKIILFKHFHRFIRNIHSKWKCAVPMYHTYLKLYKVYIFQLAPRQHGDRCLDQICDISTQFGLQLCISVKPSEPLYRNSSFPFVSKIRGIWKLCDFFQNISFFLLNLLWNHWIRQFSFPDYQPQIVLDPIRHFPFSLYKKTRIWLG